LKIGNSAVYLFFDSIFGLGIGYIFWIIVSRLAGSSVTGETSSSMTLALVLATIFTFGISTGSQRFLGKAYSKKNDEDFREIAKFSILFTIGCMTAISITLIIFNDILVQIFPISAEMSVIIVIASVSYALSMSLRGILIPQLKTRSILIIFLISNVIRFVTLIPILIWELGAEGITMAYVSFYLSATLLLLYTARKNIFGPTILNGVNIFFNKKEVLIASLSSWAPNTISFVGNRAGLLLIFGVSGSSEAGIYFMAFGIVLALSAMPNSFFKILFPVLSGMKNNRENLLWKATKISLFITTPWVIAIAFFPIPVLSIFGDDFLTGTTILSFLAISVIPMHIRQGIGTLAYAYGKYKQVTIIGIVPTVIQVVLFILLISEYGGEGIALSIFIGSLAGLCIALVINKNNIYHIPIKDTILLIVIPISIGFLIYMTPVDQTLSFFIIIIISYLLIPRLGIIKYVDVEESINSIFIEPTKTSKKLLSIAKVLFI